MSDIVNRVSDIMDEKTRAVRFIVAFVCCGIGALGMCYLWWRWMYNYVWLVNRIFLCVSSELRPVELQIDNLTVINSPGLLNSLAGIISTLVNVYGVQHGDFSTTSKVTIVVTSVSALTCGILTLFYSLWKLRRVKRRHDHEIGKERAGRHGEGIVEQMKRKAQEKQPEPGMV